MGYFKDTVVPDVKVL